MYKEGFSKLDDLAEEDLEAFYDIRYKALERFYNLQFTLNAVGHISIDSTNNMTPNELDNMFELLKKKVELESKRNTDT